MGIPLPLRAVFAFALAAALLCGALPGAVPRAGAVALWTAGPAIGAQGAAFMLPDGRVALLGWHDRPDGQRAAGEILDLAGGTSRAIGPWPAKAGLQAPVLLNDGRLFLSGGSYMACISPGCFTTVTDAYSYDPRTERWSIAAFLPSPRHYHSAITLRDGTVLVVGGCGGNGVGASGCYAGGSPEALRYDPAADRWSGAGQTAFRHVAPRLTLLADGRVLVTTGQTQGTTDQTPNFGELYDPATGRWSRTGPTVAAREGHSATLLKDGRVLVVGGVDATIDRWSPTASAELYDPAADRWSRADALTTPRRGHSATLLPDGMVLVVGGEAGSGRLASAELYDPAAGRWLPAARLIAPRSGHSATLLGDGRVFVAGGGDYAVPPSSELYGEAGPPQACFAATGRCARGLFLAYWREHGGLAINGYPLSDERYEQLEDGRFYLVQYFERVRLEFHPENTDSRYAVLLGQFGRRLHPADPPVASRPDWTYFPETGHNVPADFLAFWVANGGLAQFGFPLSEVFRERLEDGKEYEVQYFERARFERHQENASPYDVLLGQFGRRILAEVEGAPVVVRGFGEIYFGDLRVRERLGAPRANEAATSGATLRFERGLMFYRADTRAVLVLAFGPGEGAGSWASYADSWAEGQPDEGGPGPGPGLFVPRRGFGKVWREQPGVRERLGYAITADESAIPIATQRFAHGEMLWASGGSIYVLYDDGGYERYEER